MMYGRESLTLYEVQFVLHSKVLQNKLKIKIEPGEGLAMRGRSKKYNPKGKQNKTRSKSKSKRLKCFNCHMEWHFKRDCPDKKFNRLGKQNNDRNASIVLDGYESVDVLNIYDINSKREWIIDYGCTFRMCLVKIWFKNFIELNGEYIILENNKTCKVLGI